MGLAGVTTANVLWCSSVAGAFTAMFYKVVTAKPTPKTREILALLEQHIICSPALSRVQARYGK